MAATHTDQGSAPGISHRLLLGLFMPLALSAVMMVVAQQLISAGIARMPLPQASLAAYGVIMVVSIFLEAPIIVIIHVANSLVKGPVSYRRVYLLSIVSGGLLSLIHGLIAVTPLYDLVFVTIIGLPPDTALLGRTGFLIMTPWTVAIAYRRFYQGLLVSHGYTRLVGRGTTIRVTLALGVMGIGLFFPVLPGVVLGATALAISVVGEAAVIAWFARPVTRSILDRPSQGDLLAWRDVLEFFWPLGLTSLLSKLMPPLLSAVVARSPNPEVHLAGWSVAYGLLMVFFVPTQMLPQMVIPNARDRYRRRLSMSFSRQVGLFLSVIMALCVWSPLGLLYFRDLIGLQGPVLSSAVTGSRFLLLIPLLQALQNALYGAFAGLRSTAEIMGGSVVNILVILLVAGLALQFGLPGTVAAATLLTAGMVAEITVLRAFLYRRTRGEPEHLSSADG